MVVLKRKLILILTGLVFFISLLISCQEKFFTLLVECGECYEEKPEIGDISVLFSEDYTNEGVPFTLYEGKIEDNNVLMIDTSFSTVFYIEVEVGKQYAVKARYPANDKYFFVINSTDFMLKRVTDECDAVCWVYHNKEIDVRVKYPKLLE